LTRTEGAFVKETMLPNSPAVPLPIPLPPGPVKPRQLIDLYQINDIESALSSAESVFSLLSGSDERLKTVS
jgi:hypothetical protein